MPRIRQMNDKPRGIKFICYYNLVLSAIFIFGSLILFIFSRVASLESNPVTTQNLFMFVLMSLFYGFSAYKFLQRNNVIIILKKLKSSLVLPAPGIWIQNICPDRH